MSKKNFKILALILVIVAGGIFYFLYKQQSPQVDIQNNTTYVKKNYSSLKNALKNNDYQNYPTENKYLPLRNSTGEYLNPLTNQKLELDISEGGGYKCCEQPTFYAYIDKNEKLLWIEDYQASFSSSYEKWFGPFKLD